FVAAMVFVGGLRLSPADVNAEWTRRVTLTGAAITSEVASFRGLIGAEPGKGAVSVLTVETPGGEHHRMFTENMHLTLMLRTGVIGWSLLMWVIGAALAAIYRGSRAVTDDRLALMLWAIFSSGVGFLVSMSNFAAFYNPTIQILFWGMLGVGMAIVTHMNG